MNTRPKSVTIISWVLLVMSVISIFSTSLTYNNPEVVEIMSLSTIPITLQYIMITLGLTITIISAIGMLNCKNWARFLYVGWSMIGFVISLLTSPVIAMLIPGIIVFMIITFFLFSSKANIYFNSGKVVPSDS